MVDVSVNDTVVLKIRLNEIVLADDTKYDEKRTFEIIGKDYQGWFVYVPPYITIKGSVPITNRNSKSLGIDQKFIGWECLFITTAFIVEVVERKTGMVCQKCNEYYDHAVPNQEDGTMICFSCRMYPVYKSYVDDDDY